MINIRPLRDRRDIECPLRRCEEYGRSKVCYSKMYKTECKIYNDEVWITEWAKEWINPNEGRRE